MKDYYRILGVQRNASQDGIKRAFRRLARKYHPDTTEGDKKTGEGKMKEVNEAYAVLSNPDRRKKYDSDWKSFRTVRREISFEESLLGCEIKVETPDGRQIVVTVPENVRNGHTIRKDDLWVTVRFQIPGDDRERKDVEQRVKFVRQIMRGFGLDVTWAKRIFSALEQVEWQDRRIIHQLESENTELRHDNERVSEEAARRGRENARLRYENERLSEDNRDLESEHNQLRAFIHGLLTSHEHPANEYPPYQHPDNRARTGRDPNGMFTEDNDGFGFHSLGDIDPVDDPTPSQGVKDFINIIENMGSPEPPRQDRHRRNTPKSSRSPRNQSSGHFGGLSSDVGSIRKDIFGRRKKK